MNVLPCGELDIEESVAVEPRGRTS